MKIFINGEQLEVEDGVIIEHIDVVHQALLQKYSNVDIMLRTGLKVLSRGLIDKIVKHTNNSEYNVKMGMDPNLHIVSLIITFVKLFFNDLELTVEVKDNKIVGVCVEKTSLSQLQIDNEKN